MIEFRYRVEGLGKALKNLVNVVEVLHKKIDGKVLREWGLCCYWRSC